METNSKQNYVCPTIDVVEVKTEAAILEYSIPDYVPEEW